MTQNSTQSIQQPLQLQCGATLRNRIAKAAMQECLSGAQHKYYPTKPLFKLYETWAEGDFGLVLTGNVMINKKWLGDVGDVCVDENTFSNPEEMDAWRAYARACQGNGTTAVVQINHPGRQSPSGAGTRPTKGPESVNIAPSAVPLKMGKGLINKYAPQLIFGTPREMTAPEIERTIGEYINAAKVAKEAGFAGAQLHGAHGYLVCSFNNPKTNLRTDDYGGTPEKRLRFTMDILRGMRKACPAPFIIGMKINSSDTLEGGLSEEEALKQIETIASDKEAAVDFIEISGGNYEKPDLMRESVDPEAPQVHETSGKSDRSIQREALFLHAATESRKRVKKIGSKAAVMITGGFKSRSGCNEAIDDGHSDLIGIGRVTCLDPRFPKTTLFNESLEPSRARYPNYKIPGKWLFEILLPTVSAGVVTKWHVFNLWLISEGKAPQPKRSIWTFIASLVLTWRLFASLSVATGALAYYIRK